MSNIEQALRNAIKTIELLKQDINYGIAKQTINELLSALSDIDNSEPVAWREWNENTASWDFNTDGNNEEPLFSLPKPREWINLTYDQKMDLKENNDWYNFPSDLIEATEAKLKALNAKG